VLGSAWDSSAAVPAARWNDGSLQLSRQSSHGFLSRVRAADVELQLQQEPRIRVVRLARRTQRGSRGVAQALRGPALGPLSFVPQHQASGRVRAPAVLPPRPQAPRPAGATATTVAGPAARRGERMMALPSTQASSASQNQTSHEGG